MLHVVNFHYLRHSGGGRLWPPHALPFETFRAHVDGLRARFEMTSFDAALEFLQGTYTPKRDLCLLTFDDGLREHYTHAAPLLAELGLTGVFFVVTSCLDGRLASVHKAHLIMSALGEDAFLDAVELELDALDGADSTEHVAASRRVYPFDSAPVATVKYRLNYVLDARTRDAILDRLIAAHAAEPRALARSLYFDRAEAAEICAEGMTIGGHSDTHPPLASRPAKEQRDEVVRCANGLRSLVASRPLPFSYPHGSFDACTIAAVHDAGFSCAFSTERGPNERGAALFALSRFDAVDVAPDGTIARFVHA
jgi:peptidoglycan/xylan/chitin deacetylase (PgdA/CDA1 family)